MEISQNPAVELFRLMDRVRRVWQTITPCKELSKSQFGTLMAIAHGGRLPGEGERMRTQDGVTLSSLAAMMHQSLPAVSQRVSALEAQGYVARVPDPSDRRVMGARLTPEGEAAMHHAFAHFGSILDEALARLGPQNAEALVRLLAELAEALELSAANHEEDRESEHK